METSRQYSPKKTTANFRRLRYPWFAKLYTSFGTTTRRELKVILTVLCFGCVTQGSASHWMSFLWLWIRTITVSSTKISAYGWQKATHMPDKTSFYWLEKKSSFRWSKSRNPLIRVDCIKKSFWQNNLLLSFMSSGYVSKIISHMAQPIDEKLSLLMLSSGYSWKSMFPVIQCCHASRLHTYCLCSSANKTNWCIIFNIPFNVCICHWVYCTEFRRNNMAIIVFP